ncbi:MAG: ribosomal protein S18-alanine N-acetyltransferase [Candidatus Sulfobium sp.]|jgi:[ribosomal protein S18]-alanine N-acetyltransferase
MGEEPLNDISIGDMTTDDVSEVAGIERLSFTTPWSEMSFYTEVRKPGSLSKVARRGREIAGYICASRIVDEGHMLTLAVRPEFRRLGIASALIEDMIGDLREQGCRFIFLEVRSSNEAARKMYEKFNFKLFGLRKNYYKSPVEDAVLMVLKLD